jgi:hypothetical protein
MTADEVTTHLELLALATSDGVLLSQAFPVIDGAVVTGLGQVLRELHTGIDDPWTWAQWLRSPPWGYNEVRPNHPEKLIGGDVNGVVRAAARTA